MLKPELKKALFHCDLIASISLFMILAIRFFTNFYAAKVATETSTDIIAVIKVYESNPLAAALLNLGSVGMILEYIVVPAFLFACYWAYRKKTIKSNKTEDMMLLQFFVVLVFFNSLFNFVNDLSLFLGRIL